jgi:hypothetical protein
VHLPCNTSKTRVEEGEREGGREGGGKKKIETTTYSERCDVESLEGELRRVRSEHKPEHYSYAGEQKQKHEKATHETTAAPHPLF